MRTKTKSPAKSRGRWEQSRSPWYEQAAVYCDACGMLIPNRQFVVETSGGVLRTFCGPECVQLGEQVRRLGSRASAS